MSYQVSYSSRLPYDDCAYDKQISESNAPYQYQMYDGKFENCNKCVYDHYTRPFDGEIVDLESELRNQTRKASKCPTKQYDPKCKKSEECTSTFDDSNPVVLAPEVCPIVKNNLVWGNETGIRDPRPSNCKGVVVGKKEEDKK